MKKKTFCETRLVNRVPTFTSRSMTTIWSELVKNRVGGGMKGKKRTRKFIQIGMIASFSILISNDLQAEKINASSGLSGQPSRVSAIIAPVPLDAQCGPNETQVGEANISCTSELYFTTDTSQSNCEAYPIPSGNEEDPINSNNEDDSAPIKNSKSLIKCKVVPQVKIRWVPTSSCAVGSSPRGCPSEENFEVTDPWMTPFETTFASSYSCQALIQPQKMDYICSREYRLRPYCEVNEQAVLSKAKANFKSETFQKRGLCCKEQPGAPSPLDLRGDPNFVPAPVLNIPMPGELLVIPRFIPSGGER